MLAYGFWHWPDGDDAAYRAALVAFHAALAAAPPPGYRGSRVDRLSGAPWTPAGAAYQDWYLVDDFTALGALNEAAVSGPRRAPHDLAAHRAAGGTAGVYRLRAGALAAASSVTWFGKPAGEPYDGFMARVSRSGAALWQRQMVLGPTPEFCLHGPPPDGVLAPLVLGLEPIVELHG